MYYQLVMQKLKKIWFHPESPVLKYHQELFNSFCLSSLASDFYVINDNRAGTELTNRIEELLIF